MKRFRFRLDSVLRIRRFEHDQEAGRFAESRRRRDQTLAAALRADESAAEISGALVRAAHQGLPALHWRANAGALAQRVYDARERRQAAEQAELELAAARERLLGARAKLRVLETLRDRALARHKSEAERREQVVLDEIGNQRAARRRAER